MKQDAWLKRKKRHFEEKPAGYHHLMDHLGLVCT
jgi:hypothetical protein